MYCFPLLDPECLIVGLIPPVTLTITGGILGGIAGAIDDGIRWIIVNTATWWVQVPSPDLAAEPAIARVQAWLLPITAAVALAGLIGAGLRMTITRRAAPLLDATGGLLALAAATTLGVVVPALLLKAGDAWSTWVLQASTGGHFAQRLAQVLELGGNAAPAVVLIFGLAAIVVSLIQAVLLLFRQLTLLVLAGVVPLAAAGVTAPMTRPWIRKVTSWMLALICYKPAAAAVYATAFTLIGSGRSPRAVLMGFVTLLLSVVMLPALMRVFTWATGSITGPEGGGQLLGAAAVGAVAVGSMRSGSGGGAASAAQGHAAYLSSQLGPPETGSTGSASPRPGPSGGPPAAGAAAASPAPSGPVSASTSAGSPSSAASQPSGTAAPTGAASTAPSAGRIAATPAGAATASSAGPVTAAAGAAVQAADAAARLADGAIGPEGQQ